MANGEYMKFDKAPASKQVLFDILNDNARLATQSRTFNQDWFAEFNSGVGQVFDGKMTAQQYCTSVKDKLQELLDKSIELKKEYVGKK
jgi:multiple sugar transport system substrate-binding protein